MRKNWGLLALIVLLCAGTTLYEYATQGTSSFLSAPNWKNLLTFVGLFGTLSLAQSVVIITGGIDLSLGSVVGFVGVLAALLMQRGEGFSPFLVIPFCLTTGAVFGLTHGLLTTYLRIQPFIITLCGLFIYRGAARFITKDTSQGFGTAYPGLRLLGSGTLADFLPSAAHPDSLYAAFLNYLIVVPIPLLLMLLLAILVGAFLHASPWGRHLFALGANEEAARFSGVRTQLLKVSAYVICGTLTALGALLMAFKVNSLGPSDFGGFYELYAIAGAVLGGCSLRGGVGNVPGVILGTMLILLLRNLVNILHVPSELEYVVVGGAILVGVCADELLSRRTLRRQMRKAV